MEQYALPIANLIEQLSKLPGIGRKLLRDLHSIYWKWGI